MQWCAVQSKVDANIFKAKRKVVFLMLFCS